MQESKRILVLQDVIEAGLLDSLLTERGIPHVMVSYRDSAYDGIYQVSRGWGHVEAPEEYRDHIMAIHDDLSSSMREQNNENE
jgi:hypothetical protein